MLEQLQDVCNELKDENEIAIIEKYGSKAKYYTTTIIRKTIVVESYFIRFDHFQNYIKHNYKHIFSKQNKIGKNKTKQK